MGFNNEGASRLIFDIETCPLDDAAEYITPAEAPANYKDHEKISAFVAEKTAEKVARAALDLDLCRIVAIGIWGEHDEQPEVVMSCTGAGEQMLLTWFWRVVKGFHLVGFNCLSFDLPVLFRRSLYLDIQAPRIAIDRFWHPEVTDLMQELSYGQTDKVRGLDFYSRRFGLDIPQDTSGAAIGELVKADDWDAVEAHCRADVQRTAALAARLGYFRPLAVGASV